MDTSVVSQAERLCERVAALIDSDRIGSTARPLLAAARAMIPDGAPKLVLLAARILVRDGDHQASGAASA